MREKPPPDPPEDVPLWFVTYSDVITLLMTFFILLLTFASAQPEHFHKMQVSMFGGGEGSGIAGAAQDAMEKDAIALRERPRSSRMTDRGSETPPVHKDPALKSLSEGINGLENTKQNLMDLSHSIRMPTNLLVTDNGEITPIGRVRLRMLARKIRQAPYHLSVHVGRTEDLEKVMVMTEHLVRVEAVTPGKIGVGMVPHADPLNQYVDVIMTRQHQENVDGS